MQGPRLSKRDVQLGKCFRDLVCLVKLARASRSIHDLLQAQNIHIEFLDHANHALRRNRSMNAATLVRVV